MAVTMQAPESAPTVPAPVPPNTPRKPRFGWLQIAPILGVIGLILGVSALGVSVAAYEAANGPHVVVASATLDSGGILIPHLGHCANVTGLILNISVGGAGTVVVNANIEVDLYHTSPDYAAAAIYVSDSNASCPGAPVLAYVDSSLASGTLGADVSALGSFSVSGAGTFSFYLTGYDYSTGTDFTQGGPVNMVATFYPSS